MRDCVIGWPAFLAASMLSIVSPKLATHSLGWAATFSSASIQWSAATMSKGARKVSRYFR